MTNRPLGLATRTAIVFALTSTLLGGCAEMHHGFEAVGRVGTPSAPIEDADAAPVSGPAAKTVRSHASRAPDPDVSAAEPAERTVVASAVPSPQQIFNFHPAGSGPDSWRQPFIIDTNDGPLRAEVQHSTKELHDYMASVKSDPKTAERKRCGETDVANAKPGCVTPATKAAAAASRTETSVQ